MELFHEPLIESSFIPVSEHQSQTPVSFYSGPPVLHFKSSQNRLLCLKEEASRHPAIETFIKDGNTHEDSWLIEEIDVWVSSEKLTLWRSSVSLGLAIPYPLISLHALGSIDIPEDATSKARALYLEIVSTDGFDDHDQEGSVALNLLPQSASEPVPLDNTSEDTLPVSPSQRLYDAVTDCANLHPDANSPCSSRAGGEDENDEDEPAFDYQVLRDDSMPAALPGSGGWITSENMHEFFDEEGNWRGRGLGLGAGLVRDRNDTENGINGDSEALNSDEESKWRRTG